MKNLGILLIILGVGSFVLHMIDMEFKLLMWVDNWGETTGWAIRGAMILAGGVLLFLSRRPAASPVRAEEPHISAESQPPAESS